MLGTPHYMPPESFAGGKESVGPGADVWALGVILYETYTRQLPFDSSNPWELAAQIAKANPPSLRKAVPDLSHGFDRVCRMALAGDPEERYADGDAFADDLERAITGQSVVAPAIRLAMPKGAWVALALLPLAGVLGVALFYEPAAPDAPDDISAPRDPVTPGAGAHDPVTPAVPGYALRRGDTFPVHLGWIDDRVYTAFKGGSPGEPAKRAEVGATRFRLEQTVRDVRGNSATLDSLIHRLRITGKAELTVSFDSDTGTSILPLGHAVGKTLISHQDQRSGRLKRVFGLTGIRADALAKAGAIFKAPVKIALLDFDDLGLGRRLEVLWHVLPDGARTKEELPAVWELERPVWIRRNVSVATRVRFGREGSRIEGTLVSWTPDVVPPGTRVKAFTFSSSAEFRGGRLTRSLAVIETQVKTQKVAFEAYQSYYYGVDPCPKDWDRRLTGSGVALTDLRPIEPR